MQGGAGAKNGPHREVQPAESFDFPGNLSAGLYSVPELGVSFLESVGCVIDFEGVENCLIRIVVDVAGYFGIEHVLGSRVGRRVTNIFAVLEGDIGIVHEVDEVHGAVVVLAVGGNAHHVY